MKDRENVAIAIGKEIRYGFSIVVFTFNLRPISKDNAEAAEEGLGSTTLFNLGDYPQLLGDVDQNKKNSKCHVFLGKKFLMI